MRARSARILLHAATWTRSEPLFEVYQGLLRSDGYHRAEIESLQRTKLISLLGYAHAHVAAFANVPCPRDVVVSDSDDNFIDRMLARIPVLTKDAVQDDPSRYISMDRALANSVDYTSGSSGRPLEFRTDQFGGAAAHATVWRALARYGIDIGAPLLRIWGTQLDVGRRSTGLIKDLLLNRRTISSHHITDESARKCLRQLSRRRVEVIYGFTSAVSLLAHKVACHRQGIRAGQNLKTVVVTGERLDAEIRKRIESAFAAKVCQEYGCTEAGPIAHECPEGSLHVNEENIVLECAGCRRRFTPDEPCCDGGEVLVTELNNRVMPVIRYLISDRVRVEPGFCGCGRQTVRIAAVIGRELDALLLKDGSLISGTFFDYLPKYLTSEIIEMQFVQRVPGIVEVIFVRGSGFHKNTLNRLAAKIAEGAGTALEVLFKEVTSIPREPSGKIRLVRRIIDSELQGNPYG